MSNLKNQNPLSYEGVSAYSPPELHVFERNPKGSDYEQFSLGDLCLNKTNSHLFVLVSQHNRTSNWVELYPGAGAGSATDFACDIGTAVAQNRELEVMGGASVSTFGAGNILAINLKDDVTILGTLTMDALGPGVVQAADNGLLSASRGDDGELLIGATGANPAWAEIISSNGTVGVTNGPHTIDLRVIGGGGAGGAITDIDGNVGTASPVGGVIAIVGGDNINTIGAVDTLTVHLDKSILLPATNAAGDEGLYSLGGNDFLHSYGTQNTFSGENAGNRTLTVISAVRNTGIGFQALNGLTTSLNNLAVGRNALTLLSTGDGENVSLGTDSLALLVSGAYNIAVGYGAGSAYTLDESSNIVINNEGVITESNVIRIGTEGWMEGQQGACYVAGIYNKAIGATNHLVSVDSFGKLGYMVGGLDGQILVGADAANPAWFTLISSDNTIQYTFTPNAIDIRAVGGGGGGAVNTLAGDVGVANPVGGIINVLGGDNINTAAAGNTVTVHLDKSISQPATNAVGDEGLYSLGGLDFMHAYGTHNTFLGENAGNRTLTVIDAIDNTGIGYSALRVITTAERCTAVGSSSQFNNLTSSGNTSLGALSLASLTVGDGNNTAVGYNAMYNAVGNTCKCTAIGYQSLMNANNTSESTCMGYRSGENMTGDNNTAIGSQALMNLTTGHDNCCLGEGAGQNYTSGESNNICIGNSGQVGESNRIRIGKNTHFYTYIAGIYGNNITGNKGVVFVDSNNKLGTSAGTDGQLLIGANASNPAWAGLTSSDASIDINYVAPNIDLTLNQGPFPDNPAFSGYNAVNDPNVTGDGTLYLVSGYNEIFDRGNDFNAATGSFIAPVDGIYYFTGSVFMTNVVIVGNYWNRIQVQTSVFDLTLANVALQCGDVSAQVSGIMSLVAGNFARLEVTVDTGGGRTIGVGANQTFFSGYLIQEL